MKPSEDNIKTDILNILFGSNFIFKYREEQESENAEFVISPLNYKLLFLDISHIPCEIINRLYKDPHSRNIHNCLDLIEPYKTELVYKGLINYIPELILYKNLNLKIHNCELYNGNGSGDGKNKYIAKLNLGTFLVNRDAIFTFNFDFKHRIFYRFYSYITEIKKNSKNFYYHFIPYYIQYIYIISDKVIDNLSVNILYFNDGLFNHKGFDFNLNGIIFSNNISVDEKNKEYNYVYTDNEFDNQSFKL